MPGVPDIYQGTELWEGSLVDPDNRRPVDYAARAELLAEVLTGAGEGTRPRDGCRAEPRSCWSPRRRFGYAASGPSCSAPTPRCAASGPAADHIVAYDRGGAVTVATRLPVGLAARGGWADTELTLDGDWTDRLTGRTYAGPIALADLLATYPVSLLTR